MRRETAKATAYLMGDGILTFLFATGAWGAVRLFGLDVSYWGCVLSVWVIASIISWGVTCSRRTLDK